MGRDNIDKLLDRVSPDDFAFFGEVIFEFLLRRVVLGLVSDVLFDRVVVVGLLVLVGLGLHLVELRIFVGSFLFTIPTFKGIPSRNLPIVDSDHEDVV